MRDEYLEDLVDAGEIMVREFSDGHGHNGSAYFLAAFAVTNCDYLMTCKIFAAISSPSPSPTPDYDSTL